MAAIFLEKHGQREMAVLQRSATEIARSQKGDGETEGERTFLKFSVSDNFPLKCTPSLILVVPVLALRDVSITL